MSKQNSPVTHATNLASEPVSTPTGDPVYSKQGGTTQEAAPSLDKYFGWHVVRRTLEHDTLVMDDEGPAKYLTPEVAFEHLALLPEVDFEDAKMKGELIVYYVRAITEVDANGNPVHWKNCIRQTEQTVRNFRTGELETVWTTSAADKAAMETVQAYRKQQRDEKRKKQQAETAFLNQLQAKLLKGRAS